MANARVPQAPWECTPWAAEATSLLPAGPAACQRLGLGTYYKSSCNAGGAAAGSCWALAGSEKRVQKLVSCIWGSAKHHYATLGFQCLI